ncbi:MAG: hypothetical protein EON47_15295, partial [Acetobacteraceae bacterium]
MAGAAGMRQAVLLLLALAVPLAGCGRAGPPRPPGPKDQIIYPRGYPRPDPVPGAAGSAPRVTPPEPNAMVPFGTSPGAAPNTA